MAKITIVGRPCGVERFDSFMILHIKETCTPPLPKGLPPLQGETHYNVFMALKHWNRVAPALQKSEDDTLIIEGIPQANGDRMDVSALHVTTKALQVAKYQEKTAA
jgi:hypothetical protein